MSDADMLEAPIGAEHVQPLRVRYTRASFLRRIADDIRALLGPERVQRMVLYGSRARGDAREHGGVDDSDWDIAVFLRGEPPKREEKDRLYGWKAVIGEESGWDVSPRLFGQDGWLERTMFMHNLRFDMIDL